MTGNKGTLSLDPNNDLGYRLWFDARFDHRRNHNRIVFKRRRFPNVKRGCTPRPWSFPECMRRMRQRETTLRDVRNVQLLVWDKDDTILALDGQRIGAQQKTKALRSAAEKVLAQFDGIGDDAWATRGMKQAIERLREVVG